MSDLDDFVKNNAPSGKKSKLAAFAGEIFTLKDLGYSEKDILRFLLEKKEMAVSQPTLNRFIRSRAGQTALVSETRPLPVGVQTENRQAAAVVPKVQPEKQTEPEKAEHPIIGKFDLSRKIDTDELM